MLFRCCTILMYVTKHFYLSLQTEKNNLYRTGKEDLKIRLEFYINEILHPLNIL